MKQTFDLYVIRDTAGRYYRPAHPRWIQDIQRAKWYPKIGSAKGAIAYHHMSDVKIVHLIASLALESTVTE